MDDLPEVSLWFKHGISVRGFAEVGLFNTFLGRKKKNLLSKEETDYFYRVTQAGLKIIYTPKALLYHRIPSERTEPSWILSRHYWQGVSNIAFKQIHRRLGQYIAVVTVFDDQVFLFP